MPTDPTYLVGWGAHHPAGRLTNDELIERLETTPDWLDSHVGIEERRISEADDTIGTLGAAALDHALAGAGLEAGDLDVIIGASSFDDHDMPAAAARIADEVGSGAFTFDVRAACSGWPVGIEIARTFLDTGRADTVAVVASERTSLSVDPEDRGTVVFFGDAAGAGIVTRGPVPPGGAARIVDLAWHADNQEHAVVRIPHGGWFEMDGRHTRTWVEKAMAETAAQVLDRNGVASADLRALVCHQANLRLIERFAAQLGVPPERHWHNVEWAGNTSASGAPTSLAGGLDASAEQLDDGDHILVVTVGAGLNVVAMLLRWERP
ncbi:MAG TPA: ketoacyl-ACP synthase III [Acidimicrobiales bacterium]|jgi:3-oxoacyl-[acyl-carrier-protein] synthase-3|nr:ketoacyl-ACP synthase III [Acidimicrobiales bacterium]